MLGLAYATTHDPRYLDALAAQTVGASRWPDWNPGHPLDTAQVATAVALGYAWSRDRMTPDERARWLGASSTGCCSPTSAALATGWPARRTGVGNQTTVVGTAAVLAGLAIRTDEPAWSAAAVEAGTALAGAEAAPDGSGRSVADGPTVEGLMYTNYEAAQRGTAPGDRSGEPARPGGHRRAAARRCRAWTRWPSGTSAAAGWPTRPCRTAGSSTRGSTGPRHSPRWPRRRRSGPHVLALLDALQAQGQVDRAWRRHLAAPDGHRRAGALAGRARCGSRAAGAGRGRRVARRRPGSTAARPTATRTR